MTPEFAAVAYLKLQKAMDAGDTLCQHCLHCGKCEHAGDENISVKLCAEARILNMKWTILSDEAKPYMEVVKREQENQTE